MRAAAEMVHSEHTPLVTAKAHVSSWYSVMAHAVPNAPAVPDREPVESRWQRLSWRPRGSKRQHACGWRADLLPASLRMRICS